MVAAKTDLAFLTPVAKNRRNVVYFHVSHGLRFIPPATSRGLDRVLIAAQRCFPLAILVAITPSFVSPVLSYRTEFVDVCLSSFFFARLTGLVWLIVPAWRSNSCKNSCTNEFVGGWNTETELATVLNTCRPSSRRDLEFVQLCGPHQRRRDGKSRRNTNWRLVKADETRWKTR